MAKGSLHEKRNSRILELGTRYHQKMQGLSPSLFDRKHWQGEFINRVMEDEEFKIDAFRFIDVLPSLQSSSSIASHVHDYLLKEGRELPRTVRLALNMTGGRIMAPIGAKLLRSQIADLARRLICESEKDKALKVLRKLAKQKITFTADILGEATTSDYEAEQYLQKYFDLITLLSAETERWPDLSREGQLPKANVSVKISALDPYLDAADHDNSVSRLKERLLPLLRHAKQKNVFINFDLEQWVAHGITYALFEELAQHPDLIDWPHMGVVIQAYLKTSRNDCDRLLALSKNRGTPFTVRLVKGAYWDYEVVHARQNGFACPVYTSKGLTDANYEHLSIKLLDNRKLITTAFASHNLRSLVHAVVVAEEKGLEKADFELQMLFGMAEPERRVFADEGYRVRVYCPIGELLPGMAYLVRRLLENTSNSGFLRLSYHEKVSIAAMLESPALEPEETEKIKMVPGDIDSPFSNTGLLDFCEHDVRKTFDDALAAARRKMPIDVPVVVNGNESMTEETFISVSPSDHEMKLARVSRAGISHAEEAAQAALKAFPEWRDKPLRKRAELLEKLAGQLEQERFVLAALMSYEVGKPRREADADVAEAIDFCRYYARQALKELAPVKQGDFAGEDNVLFYEGRGPAVIIAPWNFPLAILCGMTAAALVAGNTVIIKPASTSSAVGHQFYTHLSAAGFSPDVVQFLPGSGEEVGNYLVNHPAVAQIVFTGSREVGLGIIEQAARTQTAQQEVKRVVCEMGGKNAIVVDEDADLDAAIKGVIQSAFGYAGQKCSACSRLILVESIYELFIKRLVEACKSLPVAGAADEACRLGPVIDKKACERLKKIIADPPAGAELLFVGTAHGEGYFVPPAIFRVNDVNNPMMQDELFGPLLSVMEAENFGQAIRIANTTEFALTGSVYSRSPRNLKFARQHFKVGNLYVNRNCTGAIVNRQPFGGYKMSGTGTKTGGPGYLLHFVNPRCITENTMRSGFIPEFQL